MNVLANLVSMALYLACTAISYQAMVIGAETNYNLGIISAATMQEIRKAAKYASWILGYIVQFMFFRVLLG